MNNWMIFSLAVILALSPLAALAAMIMIYQSQTRLLRLISAHLGISPVNMERAEPPKEVVKLPDLRRRVAIPVPGSGVTIPQSERVHIGPRP